MLLLGLQSPASWLGSGSGATNRLSTPDVRASQPTHSPRGEICTLAASAFAKSAVRGTECSKTLLTLGSMPPRFIAKRTVSTLSPQIPKIGILAVSTALVQDIP
jgi:hypothetical protein